MALPALKNLSVAQRLGGGFGFVMLLVLAMSASSALEMRGMSQRLNQIVEVNNTRTALANDLLNVINSMAIQSRTVTLLTDVSSIDKEIKDFQKSVAAYDKVEKALVEALAADDESDPGRKLLNEIVAAGKKTMPGVKEAVKQGFDYRGVITTQRVLIGGETLLVLEREQGQSLAQNEYVFLNTKKESTLEKEMETAVSQGYIPVGFTRTEDRSVKQQMFGIMAGSPMELTMILARKRETPASEMGQREFKILTTYKIGTLEKEMNQAAKEGYRFFYAAPNTIAIVARDPKNKTAQYEYKLLGTHKVGTMEKEMNELGATGFSYRATSTGAGGLTTVFEKKIGMPAAKYETKLVTKLTDTSTNKTIQDMKKSGFELIDISNLGQFLMVLQKDPEK